jgi:hypothetical protein
VNTMDDELMAYNLGRSDGGAGRRDAARADDPQTGADYRMGFLDGRIEVFQMLAQVRKFLDDGR